MARRSSSPLLNHSTPKRRRWITPEPGYALSVGSNSNNEIFCSVWALVNWQRPVALSCGSQATVLSGLPRMRL